MDGFASLAMTWGGWGVRMSGRGNLTMGRAIVSTEGVAWLNYKLLKNKE